MESIYQIVGSTEIAVLEKHAGLILRSLRSKRLEGSKAGTDSRPSFETHRSRDAPQDEVG
jgi:hypothetical protein